MTADESIARLRQRAAAVDLDPDAAEGAAAKVAAKAGMSRADAADALCQQLDAGVGLDAAVAAITEGATG